MTICDYWLVPILETLLAVCGGHKGLLTFFLAQFVVISVIAAIHIKKG